MFLEEALLNELKRIFFKDWAKHFREAVRWDRCVMIEELFVCFSYYIRSFFLTYICVSLSATTQLSTRRSFIRCECLTFATTTILLTISAPWRRLLNAFNCLFEQLLVSRTKLERRSETSIEDRHSESNSVLASNGYWIDTNHINFLKISFSNVAF